MARQPTKSPEILPAPTPDSALPEKIYQDDYHHPPLMIETQQESTTTSDMPLEPPSNGSKVTQNQHLTPVVVKSENVPEDTEIARTRSEGTDCEPKLQWAVHWLSPTSMVGTLLAGVACSVGHHLYYTSLDHQTAGDASRQQWALQFGNAFAFLVKALLSTSAGIAYLQWLWKTLRKKYITIGGLDAAFAIESSFLSFFNLEMISNIKIGMFVALIVWCIPLAALITPATLAVVATQQNITVAAQVPTLDISAYIPLNISNSPFPGIQRFVEITCNPAPFCSVQASSKRMARIASASSTSGQRLPIIQYFSNINASYSIEFYGPSIKCDNASAEIARNTTVGSIIFAGQGGAFQNDINIGLSPANNSWLNTANIDFNTLQWGNRAGLGGSSIEIDYFAVSLTDDVQGGAQNVFKFDPSQVGSGYPANRLLIAVADQQDVVDNELRQPVNTTPRFYDCQLWNASYVVNVSSSIDGQLVEINSTRLNTVPARSHWGTNVIGANPDNLESLYNITGGLSTISYNGYFRALAQQLTGLFATECWFSRHGPQCNILDWTNIGGTYIAGASEVVNTLNDSSTSGALGQYQENLHRSLPDLIEEYALNATVNMLSDPTLSIAKAINITQFVSINTYVYHPHNLVLAYGVAILFALLANILGAVAYYQNGVSYESSISSIIRTTQNPDIANLVRFQALGAQPLDLKVAKTRLRFGLLKLPLGDGVGTESKEKGGKWHATFGVQGTITGLRKGVKHE